MYISVNCKKGINSYARSIKIFYPSPGTWKKNPVWTGKNIQFVFKLGKKQFIKLVISNWRMSKIPKIPVQIDRRLGVFDDYESGMHVGSWRSHGDSQANILQRLTTWNHYLWLVKIEYPFNQSVRYLRRCFHQSLKYFQLMCTKLIWIFLREVHPLTFIHF